MNGSYSPRGFSYLSPVVKHLLIINGLFFLATMAFAQAFRWDITQYLALFNPASQNFSPYQFITYMFMHANLAHIFFNMFALWMFGVMLERVWGSQRFLIFYVVCGLGAAIIHLIIVQFALSSLMNSMSPEMVETVQEQGLEVLLMGKNYTNPEMAELNRLINTPMVGASGSVYGILLAFGMLFPNMLVYIYFLFPIKAKYLVILLGALELYSGFASGHGSGVAHFAHLGGMIFGFIMIRLWKNKLPPGGYY